MPIPFLEALRGRLAPVFNGTVPLEREKEEKGHKRGLAGKGGAAEKDGTNTQQAPLKQCTSSTFSVRR